jgi:hypothetical protein
MKPPIKPKLGRPPIGELGRVEGMKVFCAKWGCSTAMLKTAKQKGCAGFYQNRIDPLVVIPFIFNIITAATNLPDGLASWKEVREMNDALISEVKRKEAQKLVMLTSDGKRQAADAMASTFSELDRRDRELPPALAGRSAVEIS